MARVTVEDCLENVDNRFELVLVASKRARQLARHQIDPTVEWDNDKATVVALREIAQGSVNKEILRHREPVMSLPSREFDFALQLSDRDGF